MSTINTATSSSTTDPPPSAPRDPTFRNYNPSSAATYAAHRPPYPSALISSIIAHHTSTGGQLELLLDVGCGPGTATRSLAPYFDRALGLDPGQAMIEKARSIPSVTASGESVRYEVCAAEELDRGVVQPRSVDLITAATSAHWFEMEKFYIAAARVLKPGGGIAIWCHGGFFVDPRTTPNAAKVQEIFSTLEDKFLAPYYLPGNHMCRNLYAELPLPWNCLHTSASPSASASGNSVDPPPRPKELDVFSPEPPHYIRTEYNKDGHVAAGEKFLHGRRENLDEVKRALSTASMVTRWREANRAGLESGQVEDAVERVVREMREAMADGVDEMGQSGAGRDWIEGGMAVVVLGLKKVREIEA